MAQCRKVLFITGIVREIDVELAVLFTEGKVVPAMNRNCQYIGVPGEDLSCAVTLMYIQVDDSGTPDTFLGAQPTDGDRHVVKHAET